MSQLKKRGDEAKIKVRAKISKRKEREEIPQFQVFEFQGLLRAGYNPKNQLLG